MSSNTSDVRVIDKGDPILMASEPDHLIDLRALLRSEGRFRGLVSRVEIVTPEDKVEAGDVFITNRLPDIKPGACKEERPVVSTCKFAQSA